MNQEVITLLEQILDINDAIGGVAMVDGTGAVLFQTENWDLRNEAPGIITTWTTCQGSITVMGVRYVIVENTPERLIGTNVTGKGHIMCVTAGTAKIIVYIEPTIGPTQVLNDVFLQAMKIGKLL